MENMCSIIDITVFSIKRSGNFDKKYAMLHGNYWPLQIAVIFYFVFYSVIIMTISNSSCDCAYYSISKWYKRPMSLFTPSMGYL